MPLSPGDRLGPYDIHSRLGAGGMGEVYRARDGRLKRDVALKVLPAALAADPERVARFQREAELVAGLTHPNIAALYGLEESPSGDGTSARALVLELVEGETLAARLERGPLAIDESLGLARQLTEALEYAHERGVLHRDLKPANIKVTPEGRLKVLDFGLAKALGSAAPELVSLSPEHSPTITSPALTRAGMLLGTAAYMAPEQARGKPVDKRADLWAFGCVLYEMLTARRAFSGETVSDTLVSVLSAQPDLSALPASTPPSVRRLLRRCLAKERRDRLADASDARLDLDEAIGDASAPGPAHAAAPPRPARAGVVVAVALASAVATGFATRAWFTNPVSGTAPRVTRTSIVAPASAPFSNPTRVAISPDGRRIAYSSTGGRLMTRDLDDPVPRLLFDGDGVITAIAFSPDGEWVFFHESLGGSRTLSLRGGPPRRVPGGGAGRLGATWIDRSTIIYGTGDPDSGLVRASTEGGDDAPLTTPNRAAGEVDHVYPAGLPGGRNLLFTVTRSAGPSQSQIAVLDLASGTWRALLNGAQPMYAASGHLLYTLNGSLWAVPFDVDTLTVSGASRIVLENVSGRSYWSRDLSSNGTLVYARSFATERVLIEVDRQGRESALGAPVREFRSLALSPDGGYLAVTADGPDADSWRWDLKRRQLEQRSFGVSNDLYPLWSADGGRLFWSSDSDTGMYSLRSAAADGSGSVEPLAPRGEFLRQVHLFPTSVTPDGTRLVLRAVGLRGEGTDIMQLTFATGELSPVLATDFSEAGGRISPDGRWLAYQSDESGTFEIYVRPFPEVERSKVQISAGGGTQPVWRRDGNELFFRRPDGAVMAVAITGRTPALQAGPAAQVVGPGYYTFDTAHTYDVSADGTRFYMIKDTSADVLEAPTLTVVQHFFEELKRLVP